MRGLGHTFGDVTPSAVLAAVSEPALSASSGFPEAVELVRRLYDRFGFDTVDNSPLSESWRSGSGQPAWVGHEHQTRTELIANLARARRIISR